jgi:uncharacterized membrane protein (DUF373 family)
VIRVLGAMMALAIAGATVNLVWGFVRDLLNEPPGVLTVTELLDLFGSFLIVLIGLELLETVRLYAAQRHVHVEAVLLVAMIAILRKVITLDLKEQPAATLLAIGSLVLALAGAYWLMRQARRTPKAEPPPPAGG